MHGVIPDADDLLEDDMVKITRKKRAQSAMESVVVFLAGTMIISIASSLLIWGVSHIPARQMSYEATRVLAGTPHRVVTENGATPTPMLPVWPTYVVSAAGGINR